MAGYYQSFVVTGVGYFPLDMLRYDYCYPADDSAVKNIVVKGYYEIEERSVRLARTVEGKDIQPTTGRWLSFGWQVSDIVTRKR